MGSAEVRVDGRTVHRTRLPPPFPEPLHWVTVAPVVDPIGVHATMEPPPWPEPMHWLTVAGLVVATPVMLLMMVTVQVTVPPAPLPEPLHWVTDVTSSLAVVVVLVQVTLPGTPWHSWTATVELATPVARLRLLVTVTWHSTAWPPTLSVPLQPVTTRAAVFSAWVVIRAARGSVACGDMEARSAVATVDVPRLVGAATDPWPTSANGKASRASSMATLASSTAAVAAAPGPVSSGAVTGVPIGSLSCGPTTGVTTGSVATEATGSTGFTVVESTDLVTGSAAGSAAFVTTGLAGLVTTGSAGFETACAGAVWTIGSTGFDTTGSVTTGTAGFDATGTAGFTTGTVGFDTAGLVAFDTAGLVVAPFLAAFTCWVRLAEVEVLALLAELVASIELGVAAAVAAFVFGWLGEAPLAVAGAALSAEALSAKPPSTRNIGRISPPAATAGLLSVRGEPRLTGVGFAICNVTRITLSCWVQGASSRRVSASWLQG